MRRSDIAHGKTPKAAGRLVPSLADACQTLSRRPPDHTEIVRRVSPALGVYSYSGTRGAQVSQLSYCRTGTFSHSKKSNKVASSRVSGHLKKDILWSIRPHSSLSFLFLFCLVK